MLTITKPLEVLEKTKRKACIKDLARAHGFFSIRLASDNLMIDSYGSLVAIDLSEASVLPPSFAKNIWENRLGFEVEERVLILATEGIDNTPALLAAAGFDCDRLRTVFSNWAAIGTRRCRYVVED